MVKSVPSLQQTPEQIVDNLREDLLAFASTLQNRRDEVIEAVRKSTIHLDHVLLDTRTEIADAHDILRENL